MEGVQTILFVISIVLAVATGVLLFSIIVFNQKMRKKIKQMDEILTQLNSDALLASADLEKLSDVLTNFNSVTQSAQQAAQKGYNVLASPVFKALAIGHGVGVGMGRLIKKSDK